MISASTAPTSTISPARPHEGDLRRQPLLPLAGEGGVRAPKSARLNAAPATQTAIPRQSSRDLARRLFAHFESHEDVGRESETRELFEGRRLLGPVESDDRVGVFEHARGFDLAGAGTIAHDQVQRIVPRVQEISQYRLRTLPSPLRVQRLGQRQAHLVLSFVDGPASRIGLREATRTARVSLAFRPAASSRTTRARPRAAVSARLIASAVRSPNSFDPATTRTKRRRGRARGRSRDRGQVKSTAFRTASNSVASALSRKAGNPRSIRSRRSSDCRRVRMRNGVDPTTVSRGAAVAAAAASNAGAASRGLGSGWGGCALFGEA